MKAQEPLRSRVEQLLREAAAARDRRRTALEHDMRELEEQEARLEKLSKMWFDGIVMPKLEVLAAMLPGGTSPRRHESSRHVSLEFPSNDDFPVSVRLEIWIAQPRGDEEHVRVTVQASFIPILTDLERESSFELSLESPDMAQLEVFLDDRLAQFAHEYLRSADPDSPYQRTRLVTDPVCGMVLRRADAAGSVEFGKRTYYFCMEGCRERFEAAPEQYAKP